MFRRALQLAPTKTSFFLWGPRQSGKSTLLKNSFPEAPYVDLLLSTQYVKYAQRPDLLVEELRDLRPGSLVLVDEVQKVPQLLDSIHWLIENSQLIFGLCGSSARKVRQGQANLL